MRINRYGEDIDQLTPTDLETPDAAEQPQQQEQLPQQIIDLLKGTIKDFQKQDTFLRRREVMRDRKARFYERGYQHLQWTGQGQGGGFTQITQGMTLPGSSAQAPQYVDDYDIFWPYERIVLSILTQNIPGVDFQPIDPDRVEDIEAAATAEAYSRFYDRSNNIKQIQTASIRMMMLGGRSIAWTRTGPNKDYVESSPSGAPKEIETTTIYGTLESRVPIMAKCLKDALYCFLYDDPQVTQAKAEYPEFAKEIKANESGLGENQYERLARLGALQGSRAQMASGESFSYLTTRMECYLRPECWMGQDQYDVALEVEGGGTARDYLAQQYPEGLRATFVGETYVACVAESVDDHITIDFPIEGDGMFRHAPMDCMLVNQDAFNDAMNAARLIFDEGWPSRWVGADQSEFDTIVGQVATPFALRLKRLATGAKATDSFFQEPNPELPETFVQYMEFVQGALAQFQTATPPALWGAQMEDQKTAHGYAQAQQSAMGQLGMIWAAVQHQFARIRYQAAMCAADNPELMKPIVVPGGGGQNSTMHLEKLTKGHFGAFPDEDSSFPETTAAKRATFDNVMTQLALTPLAPQIFGAPDNISAYLREHGLAEIVIPEAESRDAQQFEIEELLQQAPMVSPMALEQAQIEHATQAISQPPGQPTMPFDPQSLPPDQPSVDVNEYDYHQWHAAKCQDWLNGPARRQEEARGNQAGILNVELHWKKHVAAIAQTMMAMQPPPMAAPPAPKPPGAPGQPKQPPAAQNTPPALPQIPGAM